MATFVAVLLHGKEHYYSRGLPCQPEAMGWEGALPLPPLSPHPTRGLPAELTRGAKAQLSQGPLSSGGCPTQPFRTKGQKAELLLTGQEEARGCREVSSQARPGQTVQSVTPPSPRRMEVLPRLGSSVGISGRGAAVTLTRTVRQEGLQDDLDQRFSKVSERQDFQQGSLKSRIPGPSPQFPIL